MPAPDYAFEIAALENLLATGELEIQSGGFGGDKIVYKSTSDVLVALTYFQNKAAANALAGRPATTLASFDRG